MQSFIYHCPTEIVFGRGAEHAAAEKLRAFGASRILVLYGGGSVLRSGLLSRIEEDLTSSLSEAFSRTRASPLSVRRSARGWRRM